MGSRGAERPTLAPSETKAVKRIARFVGNKNPCQNSHGRAREDVNPLDFQSRPATCASERLLAQRAGKSLCDRPSEIKDFAWSPRALIFFRSGGLPPPEKKSLPCRFRARKSAGFQRNLRKGGVEGNPSSPRPGELERVTTLSNFQSKRFPQEIASFSPMGWRAVRPGGGGACSPARMRQASSQMRRALLIPTPVAYRPSSSPSNSMAMSPS